MPEEAHEARNRSQPGSSEVSQEEVDTLLSSLGQQAGEEVLEHANPKEAPGSGARIQMKAVMSNMMTRFGVRLVLGTKSSAVSDTLRSTGHVFTTETTITSHSDRTKATNEAHEPSKRMETLALTRLRRLASKYPRRCKVVIVTTAQLIKNAAGVEKLSEDPVDMEWLASLSQSSVKTVTAMAISNIGTGHTVYGVHETTVHFRRIPDSVAHTALNAALPLVPVDRPEFSPFLDRIEGSPDSAHGFPLSLFNTLITDVIRVSASEMMARENALTLADILPSWGCLRAALVLAVGLLTTALLYLLWHFNAEHGAALSPLQLLTGDAFSAVAYHGASRLLEPRLEPLKRERLAQLRGSVVEVGAGAGANVAFYGSSAISELTLAEPSPVLRAALAQRVEQAGLEARVVSEAVEDLEVPPRSVDFVVMTLSLNCVSSTQLALNRIYDWLKPGGQLVVVETIDSPFRGRLLFAVFEWLVERTANLLWGGVSGGCHFGHDTLTRLQTLKGTRFKHRRDTVLPYVGVRVVSGVVERIV